MDIRFLYIEANQPFNGREITALILTDDAGTLGPVEHVAETLGNLAARHGNVVICGTDPFRQAGALAVLVMLLKRRWNVTNIEICTPQSFIDLCQPDNHAAIFMSQIIAFTDILLDGTGLRIDIPASLRAIRLITYKEECHAEPDSAREAESIASI